MADSNQPESVRARTKDRPDECAGQTSAARAASRLTTLGRLSLEGAGLNRPKPLLLLAYLAIEGPKPRRFLSELFFPTAKDPRDALSTTLGRLNRAAGDVVFSHDVLLRASVTCDAVDVLEHLDAGRRVDAVRAYTAPFLERLDLSLPPELEDWVFLTREHLAERVLNAAIDEVATLEPGDTQRSDIVSAAMTLSEQCEPQPEAIRQLVGDLRRLGVAAGQRLAMLAARNGVEPRAVSGSAIRPVALALGPEPAGTLIGREAEVHWIVEAFQRPGVRLVTIHGPGGVGKSRLALHVVRHPVVAARFGDHRTLSFVEPASDATLLPGAIAAGLGLALPPDARTWHGLADAVRHEPVLIVLDGWDLHIASTPHLATFLRAAAGAHVLVTSRQRLHLAEEHVLSLRGLAVPGSTTHAAARDSAAVRMLLDEARRHDLAFSPSNADLDDVARVCNALGGLPLGLKLAASWMRWATLADIATTVERDATELDRVGTAGADAGSLLSVVERTWGGLGARGRAVARSLSAFRGGFRRDAAAAVAGASIADLARLVDGAWLTMRRDGRFEQHTLLRQHALASLARDPEAAHAAHAAMARTLGALVAEFATSAGSASPHLLRLVTEEEANLVACLEWASTVADGETLVTMAEALLWYFATTGRFLEAQDLFRAAAARLPEHDVASDEARAHVLASLAWCCRFAGAVEEATEHAHAALAAARRTRSSVALVRALDTIGIVCVLRGENEAARTYLLEGLTLAERSGDEVRANRVREKLVYALMGLSEMDAADAIASAALAQVEDGRVPHTIDAVATHVARAYLSLAQGRWSRAAEATAAGLEIARSLGYEGPQPLLRAASALADVQRAIAGDAERLAAGVAAAEDVLPVAQQHGDGTAEAFALMALAWACRARGRASAALDHVRAGLRTATVTGNHLTRAWILPVVVALREDAGDTAAASDVAGALLRDASTPTWIAADLRARGYGAGGRRQPDLAAVVSRLLGD